MNEHELWNEVGNLYFKAGAYDQAVDSYARAIALDASFGRPYINMALAFSRQEKHADAVALYRQGLKLLSDPYDKAFTWYKIGNAHWHMEDYSLAMDAFRKADELLPGRHRDDIASPDSFLNRRRGFEEVVPLLDLPEGEEHDLQLDSLDVAPQEFENDLYPEEFAPWNVEESLIPDEVPVCPDHDWIPMDALDDAEFESTTVSVGPLKWEVLLEPQLPDETQMMNMEAAQSATMETTASDETGLSLPERFVQEFALGNANTISNENISEVETFADVVAEPESVQSEHDDAPVLDASSKLEITNASESSLNLLEGSIVETENSLAEADISQVGESSQMIAVDDPASVVVNEVIEPAEPAEIEKEPVILASQIETNELFEDANELVESDISVDPEDGSAVVESAPSELPVPEIETATITEAPEYVAQNVTDAEAFRYQVSAFDQPVDDTASVWKEIAKIKRVLEINPQNAFAWDTLGGLYKSLGQYQQAIDAFQEAVSLDSNKTFYVYHLALVYAAEGRISEAIGAFEKVIEMDPDHTLAHATLGGYYRRQGRDDLAQSHIEKARGLLDEDVNEYNRACMEAICGNSDRALDLLAIALKNRQTYVTWVRRDPDLDFIRSDSRFNALLAEYEVGVAQ